jgi:biopolymer transport protein ExbD
MRFRKRPQDEPEINLIPFIDVLLVILIFLMLSTTYSKFTELQLRLPVADAQAQRNHPREVIVAIGADGRYAINRAPVAGRSVEAVMGALTTASGAAGRDSMVIISADAASPHQAVITVLEAARRGGFQQITFAAQRPAGAGKPS